jgi:hypothetical protein
VRWLGRTRNSLRENATTPLGHFAATQLVPEHLNEGMTSWHYKRPPKYLVGCALVAGDNSGAGRHRLEAAGIALPVRKVAALAQVQESDCASGEARGGRGMGSLISTGAIGCIAFKAPSQSRSGSRSPAFASSIILWAAASRSESSSSPLQQSHKGRLICDAHETNRFGVEPMALQVMSDRHG